MKKDSKKISIEYLALLGGITFSIGLLTLDSLGALSSLRSGVSFVMDPVAYHGGYIGKEAKDYFETLEVSSTNTYMHKFLEFYKRDIGKYYPDFSYMPNDNTIQYFVLRNMAVAGILIAEKKDDSTLKVVLDYVIPEMRDFKNGRFAYLNLRKKFLECGYQRLVAEKTNPVHVKYLLKMGFVDTQNDCLEKVLAK